MDNNKENIYSIIDSKRKEFDMMYNSDNRSNVQNSCCPSNEKLSNDNSSNLNYNSDRKETEQNHNIKSDQEELHKIIFRSIFYILGLLVSIPIFSFVGMSFLIFLQCISLYYLGINLSGLIGIITPIFTFFGCFFNALKKVNLFKSKKDEFIERIKLSIQRFKEIKFSKRILIFYFLAVCFITGIGYNIPNARAAVTDQIQEYSLYLYDDISYSNTDEGDTTETDHNRTTYDGLYNENMSFILNNKDYIITEDMYKTTYHIENPGELVPYLKQIYSSLEQNYNSNSFNRTAQSKENEFTTKKNEAQAYALLNDKNNEWYNMLPEEQTMLEAINLQESFAKNNNNYFIYSRISNNYQVLALEYINQKANSDTAKYYYMKSLENDLLSLKYASEIEEYNVVIDRIYYRYKDIRENCYISSKEKALLNIYISDLEEYLNI